MADTSARLLTLLSLLQTRRDWPGQELAGRLSVSRRTVRRDVDRLRELGYPVNATKGPDGGYRLSAGSDLPPLLFDDDQAVAVALALQTATSSIAGLDEAALRALATIRQVMPARLRHRVDALEITAVDRDQGKGRQIDQDVLLAVGAAVRAREVLRFDYPSSGDSQDRLAGGSSDGRQLTSSRRTEPHHVVAWGGLWYLVAWDLDRQDWRTFRVDRLAPRIPSGPRFARRALPAPSVAAYVRQQFRRPARPCTGEVIVSAPFTTVSRWAGVESVVEELPDGRCRLVANSWSWGGLAAWLGMYDAALEIVGPDELRSAARVLAARYFAAAADRPPSAGFGRAEFDRLTPSE